MIFHKCYACGAKEMVDMSHKLCTYIVNTAKKAKKGKDKETAKDSKERKRDKKVRGRGASMFSPRSSGGLARTWLV